MSIVRDLLFSFMFSITEYFVIVHDHDSCRTHNHVYEEVPKPCTALHSRGSFKNSSLDWKWSHSLKTSMTQFTAELRLRDLHLDAGLLQYMILHWACYISPLIPLSKECSSFKHWDLAIDQLWPPLNGWNIADPV